MKQFIYGFLLAVQFLTRVPVSFQCPWNKQTSRWALRSYPLVGLLLGFIIVFTFYILQPHLSTWMMTVLLITLWVGLTGGLHLDGWMDVADAVGSNAPLQKKWEIMKDPHVGSFGIIALLFLLIWKTVLIYSLLNIGYGLIFSIILIMATTRLCTVILLIFLPTAKKEGLAAVWKANIERTDLLFAIVPVVIVVIYLDQFLILIPAYFLFVIFYGLWVMKAFKGINGDLLGTAIEGGELWGLMIVWIYFSFVMG
ncbi:cobalamin 5'-phosphate synthase [Anaerobacillus arseniciselenatis]|uniref:Adenosylcobinamide-GDP ribazoletransferase n=1 Tax=Anaerobacillus arseniciselenatis TaxID=85682 RepID=A0A1S2LJV6_9BACI|nr:adenosylcobinamide-GDP ribazoletransferase [Anaerobacillus arseniciselenatis]OIJ12802.1 cobalamin 5'-phosphate synthase [Anaerobacillus arseniciselenatis]